MLLARRISTQEWINDFQPKATAETLTANAVNAGIPLEDIEVVDLTEAEYQAVYDSIVLPLKVAADAQAELTRQELITVINAARTAWGFTKPQMKLLVQAFRQIAEGDLD